MIDIKIMTLIIYSMSLLSCGPVGRFDSSLSTPAEESCGFQQNSLGQRVSWKSNMPIRIKLDSNWPEEWRSPVINAIEKWNSALRKEVVKLEQSENTGSTLEWTKSWPADRSRMQGVTTLTYSGYQILSAKIKINAQDYVYFDSDPNAEKKLHLESLIVHEIGHSLGLKHNENKSAVMQPYLLPGVVRSKPTDQEIKDVNCEYGL